MSSLFPLPLEETRLTLPDAKYLKDHIDRKLNIKIPLLQYEFEGLISTDLIILAVLMISESYFGLVRRKVLFSSYGSAIFKNPLQQDGTEYSVQLWGNNIQLPLEFLIYDSKSVQNSAKGTSTESDRPDCGLIIDNVCPFRR
ncbi:uncharacterized protein OCT59_010181 [Rhizophagus irregularis]|uniref:Uncharacterized protein n=1 Tax=Rhizophagus irregularis (strain DAOM 181602 / DAOM 197198 / MUCL 43194) TaxID=747089 RepID=A0A2P4QIU3_RHIID|nr:hypothetical protein GLOIN_2v1767589 [Rhizophagus irregularis DAOM 181602=DAOM 197198]POG77538.1 hypothetical protein GLOIN_2v1767589 [Rhizophagus irregularis DAOM 181602=DAOM 197198]UZO18873.1 hypothetical protein OCT59_010181 [Rhizophagus irregularis]GBC38710.2 hypothetical protein RIR_jg4014.t1 [Rhizophagus irregularis DAOM 181602=DAOM 197198]|eukprot:XP_025184404.1 hypothetical protein GLOIN_2v1767589 [Rhizophagus irregularis DAOM 181602=DAOM 197198]